MSGPLVPISLLREEKTARRRLERRITDLEQEKDRFLKIIGAFSLGFPPAVRHHLNGIGIAEMGNLHVVPDIEYGRRLEQIHNAVKDCAAR